MTSTEAKMLAQLKEHMTGIIYMHPDMAVREARGWDGLLSTVSRVRSARHYGFTELRTWKQVNDSRAILQRFIRIFGGTE